MKQIRSISYELERRYIHLCPVCKENPARDKLKTCSPECSKVYLKARHKAYHKAYQKTDRHKAYKKIYYQENKIQLKVGK